MAETAVELKLIVPEEKTRRITLIDAARAAVARANVLPPVSLEVLENLASEVLESTNGDADERAFVILMCNNELWRPYFEATPFHRRLLLMPQCLKKQSSCEAEIDELGLICAGCDQCSIHPTLVEAESIGYSTLVAEGSSAAITLVEEGAVDAILGVSCMETLQKSFSHVFSSAIPSIAIPLLKNGCADTEVDRHWLMQEISSMKPNPVIEPLSVSVMKDYAEALFTPEFLTNQFDIPNRPDVTGGMAIKSMLQGGKRMRPLLTLTSYTAYAKNFSRQIADQLMLAVECFHKASLIHDDIEDDDDYRYHQKTVHHENGIPLAINLGDYLIGQGYRKLSLLPVSGEIKLRLFDLFSSNHIELTVGQGEELALTNSQAVHDVTQTLNIFRQKTGSAIRVSLLAGAIAAEAPENDRNALGEFADLFGIAYQIRDDLTEFRCTATDQQSASYPFLKSLLVDEHQVTAATHQEWKELIKTHLIDREADIILAQTLAQMTSGLENIQSRQLRLALLNIINRYFDLK